MPQLKLDMSVASTTSRYLVTALCCVVLGSCTHSPRPQSTQTTSSKQDAQPRPTASESPSEEPRPSNPTSEQAPLNSTIQDWVDLELARSKIKGEIVILGRSGDLVAHAVSHQYDADALSLRPGSTLKPILAWGAAQAGLLKHEGYHCQRDFPQVEGLSCFDEHGPLTLSMAIERSCNTYFFSIAHRWTMEGIRDNLLHFGFGNKTGLVQSESPGVLLNDEALREHQPDPTDPSLWPAFAPMIATGHGPIQVSLIQLTLAYVTLERELRQIQDTTYVDRARRDILEGLRLVVHGEHGTARELRALGLDLAGKTGSAEPGNFKDVSPHTGPGNGWFVGFFPADHPRFFIGVLSLGQGGAAQAAVPLAGKVLAHFPKPKVQSSVRMESQSPSASR